MRMCGTSYAEPAMQAHISSSSNPIPQTTLCKLGESLSDGGGNGCGTLQQAIVQLSRHAAMLTLPIPVHRILSHTISILWEMFQSSMVLWALLWCCCLAKILRNSVHTLNSANY